jgi:hypothetical protein
VETLNLVLPSAGFSFQPNPCSYLSLSIQANLRSILTSLEGVSGLGGRIKSSVTIMIESSPAFVVSNLLLSCGNSNKFFKNKPLNISLTVFPAVVYVAIPDNTPPFIVAVINFLRVFFQRPMTRNFVVATTFVKFFITAWSHPNLVPVNLIKNLTRGTSTTYIISSYYEASCSAPSIDNI